MSLTYLNRLEDKHIRNNCGVDRLASFQVFVEMELATIEIVEIVSCGKGAFVVE